MQHNADAWAHAATTGCSGPDAGRTPAGRRELAPAAACAACPDADGARRAGRTLILGTVLGMTLCACSDMYYDRRESITFQAGDAVRANVIAQTIDPWSRASADRHIDYNGERMQRAIERYRTNKTTPLMTTSTSSVATPPGQAAPATPTP
ncbi:MAG TPA: hypothetical protein VK281_00685 [Xanthobacteraceae bacterium]|nr:hypothetical protein [Xanthobacteraceae bacterium]